MQRPRRHGHQLRSETVMKVIPQEVLEKAMRLRMEGWTWAAVARMVDVNSDMLRARLDPDYISRRQGRKTQYIPGRAKKAEKLIDAACLRLDAPEGPPLLTKDPLLDRLHKGLR